MFNISPLDVVISIAVFYWAYLALIGIYLIIGFFCLYHLARFGFFSFLNIAVILIFVGVSVWLIWYSLAILSAFDWSLPLFDFDWFNDFGSLLNPANFPTVKF